MQIPFGVLPPWMMGMMMPGNEGPPTQVPDVSVPARVTQAMQLLQHLASKRRRLPAASEHVIEVVDQDDLCSEEEAARDAALQLLARYFDGKLVNDQWEDLRYKALEKRAEMGLKEGKLIGCVGCHPMRPDPNCILCQGSGKIFVQAAGSSPNVMVGHPGDDEEGLPEDDNDE